MVGKATLAIAPSSTSSAVPKLMATIAHQRRGVGRPSAVASGAVFGCAEGVCRSSAVSIIAMCRRWSVLSRGCPALLLSLRLLLGRSLLPGRRFLGALLLWRALGDARIDQRDCLILGDVLGLHILRDGRIGGAVGDIGAVTARHH